MSVEVRDGLYEALEAKYKAIGKSKSTSLDVEEMRALRDVFPRIYQENIPGFLAKLTCEMEPALPDDEIAAMIELETRDESKSDTMRDQITKVICELSIPQLCDLIKHE